MVRGLNDLFAGVTARRDGWVTQRTGCQSITGLRGEGAGLFGGSWCLLFGTFKEEYKVMFLIFLGDIQCNRD